MATNLSREAMLLAVLFGAGCTSALSSAMPPPVAVPGMPDAQWGLCVKLVNNAWENLNADEQWRTSLGAHTTERERACSEIKAAAECGNFFQALAAKGGGLAYPALKGEWCAADFDDAMKKHIASRCGDDEDSEYVAELVKELTESITQRIRAAAGGRGN